MPARPLASVLALGCLLAAGCGGPREPVPYAYAQQWHDVMTVRILRSWDLVKRHADVAPQVTHVVEVEVLDGPAQLVGTTLELPYDGYAMAQGRFSEPPPRKTVHTITPALWVRGTREGRGSPERRWGR